MENTQSEKVSVITVSGMNALKEVIQEIGKLADKVIVATANDNILAVNPKEAERLGIYKKKGR
jgi:hypothetical protein